MMKNNVIEMLKDEISELILVTEQKGVQPSEIISLCFEDQYKEYKLFKDDAFNYFDITCLEQDGPGEFVMRYTYSKDMYLLKIEEVTDQEKIIQWDRIDRIGCIKNTMLFWSRLAFTKKKVAELKAILDTFMYKQAPANELKQFAESPPLVAA